MRKCYFSNSKDTQKGENEFTPEFLKHSGMDWSYFGVSKEQTEMTTWIYAKNNKKKTTNNQVISYFGPSIWDVAGLYMFNSLITH